MFSLANHFVVQEKSGSWELTVDSEPVKDATGSFPITHQNREFIEALSDEIQSFGDISINDQGSVNPIYFSLYAIYSDFLNIKWREHFLENLEEYIFADTTFVSAPGPENMDQYNVSAPVMDALRELTVEPDQIVLTIAHSVYFETYSGMEPSEVLEMLLEEAGSDETKTKEIVTRENLKETVFFQSLAACLKHMSDEELAALHGLVAMGGSRNFFSSFTLVMKKLSKDKYATAVLSSQNNRHGVYVDIDRDQYRADYQDKISEASIALSFIDLCTDQNFKIISAGEGEYVEFKETFSLDVRRFRNDSNYKLKKEEPIEHSSLKTIAAFLNAKGGDLFIGVNDEAVILGVNEEIDRFYKGSIDKYLLHLNNRIQDRYETPIVSMLSVKPLVLSGKIVIKIQVLPSNNPVFLKPHSDFYVRSTPATEKLTGNNMMSYIKDRFSLS